MSLSTTTSRDVAVRQFQSETALIREAGEPTGVRLAVWLLAGILFSCVTITFFVPVDRVVSSTSGQIVSAEDLTVLQSLDPSIVKSINVKAGQTVQKGDLLATLDPTFATADVGQLQQQVASYTAEIARCQAELAKQVFNPGPQPAGLQASYVALQKNLFDQRAAQYAADIHSFDEKIKLLETTINKYSMDVASYQKRLGISQQVEGMRDSLFKSGSSSLLNLLTATDSRVEMQRTMDFEHNSMVESQHQISSTTADRESYIQKWFGDTSTEMVTARNNLDTAKASLDKAVRHQELVRLTATDPGVVLTVSQLSVGSVLKEGDTLMTIMPLRSPIEAQVNINSSDIGFVRAGDHAFVKVDAFDSSEHGYAEGKVKWISENSFSTNDSGQAVSPFYKARVAIESYHFTSVPDSFRLIPGMTLEADINVGQRSLARYLLGTSFKGLGESMREP